VAETEVEVTADPSEWLQEEIRPSRSDGPVRTVTIKPAPKWPRLDARELWHYRELIATLVWRDIAVKYKQAFVGVAWAIIVPLGNMFAFTLLFGKFAHFGSNGLHYQIFVYSGMLPWTLFASGLTNSSTSLVGNGGLVTKVYFPRVVLPLAAVVAPLVDLAIASTILVGMMAWYHQWPNLAAVLAPGFLLVGMVTALGFGLFLSALYVGYRDVPYAMSFILQLWFYGSGVVAAINSYPSYAQWVLSVNPMTAVISGLQWGLLSAPAPDPARTVIGVAASFVFLAAGLTYFRRSEPRFADRI
jgi:homopolymeric O-antigen transport system permease protein